MDRYEELMARYEMMMADWMRRIEDTPEAERTWFSQGINLGKRGQLRMRALDIRTNDALWELTTEPGDTQVRITYRSGDTYLV